MRKTWCKAPEKSLGERTKKHRWCRVVHFPVRCICSQIQSMHGLESKACCYWTLQTHFCTLAGLSSPIQYCTYHCGPLSLLICCQIGRPGRRPWRDSCIHHIQRKEKRQRQWRTETLLIVPFLEMFSSYATLYSAGAYAHTHEHTHTHTHSGLSEHAEGITQASEQHTTTCRLIGLLSIILHSAPYVNSCEVTKM